MRAAGLLVAVMALGILIPIGTVSGQQPPVTVQLLWQFEAGG